MSGDTTAVHRYPRPHRARRARRQRHAAGPANVPRDPAIVSAEKEEVRLAAHHSRARDRADVPLLNSKIVVPDLPEWMIPRPRLDGIITDGASAPLTVLVGPPGSGKTFAMAAWASVAQKRSPVAWVSLDEFHNRPRAFWSYVTGALRQAGVSVPHISWTTSARSADHKFLAQVASALASQDPPVILVLDDLHVLTDTATLQSLAYVLRNGQQGLHLVVASRKDPLLPLHQFRLTGELTEIRISDLAFTNAEARLLMTQHGITLPPKLLEDLTRRAEGWAAGLRLAALSIDRTADPQQFLEGLVAEDSLVVRYIVEEVLNAQPSRLRDLLLRTSILDSFDTELASELTGEPVARELSQLVRNNAFLQPTGRGWYRYHALFAEVLRLKLRHRCPDTVPGLHQRAAYWYQRNGSLRQAVRHAAKAGDWLLAARIVVDEVAVGQLIRSPGEQPLADEFTSMPRTGTWTAPEPFLVTAALDLAENHPNENWLRSAEIMISQLPAEGTVMARAAATKLRLTLAQRTGNLAAATIAADEIEILIAAMPAAVLARRPLLGARVMSDRGTVAFWSGRLEEAAANFEAAIAALPGSEGTQERADCLAYLALADALGGRLNRAEAMATEAFGIYASQGGQLPPAANPAAHVALAAVHVERDELPQARDQLKQAQARLHRTPDMVIGTVARLVAARKALAERHPEGTRQLVQQARGWEQLPAWLLHRLVLLESRACAMSGDTSAALAAAERATPASGEAAAATATAWLAAGDLMAARDALAGHCEDAGLVPDQAQLEIWLARAQLGCASGDHAAGRRSLQRALRLAELEQIRLPLILAGTWVRHELQADPRLANGYHKLLRPELATPAGEPPPRISTSSAAPLLVEPLSSREREVLRRASEMLETNEIAATMFISVNTVKTHLKSIHRKLAVSNRGEAVRRARQLHIL
jgi:LuxR family transcriptional regulator, maltose regulon positive regulatory protein